MENFILSRHAKLAAVIGTRGPSKVLDMFLNRPGLTKPTIRKQFPIVSHPTGVAPSAKNPYIIYKYKYKYQYKYNHEAPMTQPRSKHCHLAEQKSMIL
jgi:hypothetical protein